MDFDVLLAQVAGELRDAGIPVSEAVDPHVRVNGRAKKRYGSCTKRGRTFVIELSAFLAGADERIVRTVLAHELLHTCPGCLNHGDKWKASAEKVRESLGYAVTRTADYRLLPESPPAPPKYAVRCESCGTLITRQKMSPLIRYPGRYRCRCGGRLRRVLCAVSQAEDETRAPRFPRG